MEAAEHEGLSHLIEICDTVPRAELLKIMSDCDLLLAISGRQMRYCIPYKIFDYLAVGRPILALAPEDSALSEFVKTIPLAEFADFEDKDAIKQTLRSLLSRESTAAPGEWTEFHWSRLAIDFAELIKRYGRAR